MRDTSVHARSTSQMDPALGALLYNIASLTCGSSSVNAFGKVDGCQNDGEKDDGRDLGSIHCYKTCGGLRFVLPRLHIMIITPFTLVSLHLSPSTERELM